MKKISILIAEDHELIRQAYHLMFSKIPDFSVIALCESGEEAVEYASLLQPDIVLMDINLRGMNGYEATKKIKETCLATRVISVSVHNQPATARKMIEAGAWGYVSKNSPIDELQMAIREVYSGKKFICKEVKDLLANDALETDTISGINSLTKRERHIIGFLKQGLSSKEIGEQTLLSYKTVEVHRYNILKKLDLPNVAALINYIHQRGFSVH